MMNVNRKNDSMKKIFDLFVEKESKWGDVDGMWYGFGMPDMGLPEK